MYKTPTKQSPQQPVAEAKIVSMAELEIRFKVGQWRTAETFTSLQCIDQIKEALQLQKRKKHDFFLLHFRFVNFISHQMITLNVFLYSLSITHTQQILKFITSTIFAKTKQGYFFYLNFFVLVIQPHNFMVNTACRFTTRNRKEGRGFFFYFFLQNKQNIEHAHAETHTTTTNATQE